MKQKLTKKSREKLKLPRKTRPESSSAEITVEIGLPSAKIAEAVYKSLLPETTQPSGFRSRVSVKQKGKSLELHILADDIVALRAASNTFLRFVAVATKTLSVVSPFYRKATDE